jgi:hypothetical protein
MIMHKYIKLISIPLSIEAISHFISLFLSESDRYFTAPVFIILITYIGYQAVRRFNATIWVSALLGSTVYMLDYILSGVEMYFKIFIYSDITSSDLKAELLSIFIGLPVALIISALGGWAARGNKRNKIR